VLEDGGVGRHPEGAEGLGEVGAEVGEREVEGLELSVLLLSPRSMYGRAGESKTYLEVAHEPGESLLDLRVLRRAHDARRGVEGMGVEQVREQGAVDDGAPDRDRLR